MATLTKIIDIVLNRTESLAEADFSFTALKLTLFFPFLLTLYKSLSQYNKLNILHLRSTWCIKREIWEMPGTRSDNMLSPTESANSKELAFFWLTTRISFKRNRSIQQTRRHLSLLGASNSYCCSDDIKKASAEYLSTLSSWAATYKQFCIAVGQLLHW